MARTSAGCGIPGCDGAHINEGLCHFGDGKHRSKGFCSFHYFRSVRGLPLEGPPVKANPARVLTPKEVREIRRLRAEGKTLRVIAPRYGVSMCAVSKACRGDTWADID